MLHYLICDITTLRQLCSEARCKEWFPHLGVCSQGWKAISCIIAFFSVLKLLVSDHEVMLL